LKSCGAFGKWKSITLTNTKTTALETLDTNLAVAGDDVIQMMPIYDNVVPVPVIKAPSKSFADSMEVTFEGSRPSDKIYYRVYNIFDSYLPEFILYEAPVSWSGNASSRILF
jgi:hypothetical protein